MNFRKILFLKFNYFIASLKKISFPKNNSFEPLYLMYHSVGDLSIDDKKGLFSRTKKTFEADCKLIYLFSEIFKKKIILTFDDGYVSSLEAAKYAYEKYKIESIIFLITDLINTKGFANFKMIENLGSIDGINFGFHGKTHTPLTKLNTFQINHEILKGRILLEDLCENKIDNFSYPHGLRSRETDILLAKNGFKTLFTSEYGCGYHENIINGKKEIKYKLVSRNCILNFHSQLDLYFLLLLPTFNIMLFKQKIKSLILRLKLVLNF